LNRYYSLWYSYLRPSNYFSFYRYYRELYCRFYVRYFIFFIDYPSSALRRASSYSCTFARSLSPSLSFSRAR
jgi:hypothetical protein